MGDFISITGQGIVCAIGNNASEVLDSLRRRESGIRRMRYLESKHSELPVGEVQLSNGEMQEMLGIEGSEPISRTSLMGALAVRQALRQSGLENLSGRRVTVISGTTVGDMDVTEKFYERMKTDDSLLHLPHSNECGRSTEEIASLSGLEGAEVCTVSTACSSALNAIILGAGMLMRDETDIVIAGGSESLSRFHLNGFNSLMILDRERCRPFDDTRAGLNLGEGAAFVVMQKNVPDALAYVAGYGNRCDAYHQTASSENGEGAFLAMSDALKMARLSPDDVDYVNAHGTGTPNNDRSESRALQRVFCGRMPEISSTKAFTGHTTSSSGSIETVICILSMMYDFTPANLGWKTAISGGIVPTAGSDNVALNNVMCNSFGFGGNDSSLILSRKPVCHMVETGNDDVEVAARDTVKSEEELSQLRQFVSPMESRRMGKLMKASLLSSFRALQSAQTGCPDAIVTATSRGMLETSQQFLDDINANDEQLLKPTLFMQSTHNTVGSAIAIRTSCHGYNITYSQGEDSSSWALRDARRLISSGKASSVLVCIFDESTPVFDSFAQRSGSPVPDSLQVSSIILKRGGK